MVMYLNCLQFNSEFKKWPWTHTCPLYKKIDIWLVRFYSWPEQEPFLCHSTESGSGAHPSSYIMFTKTPIRIVPDRRRAVDLVANIATAEGIINTTVYRKNAVTTISSTTILRYVINIIHFSPLITEPLDIVSVNQAEIKIMYCPSNIWIHIMI